VDHISLVLVDRQALFLEGLLLALSGTSDLEVLERTSDSQEALTLVETLSPRVVVLDADIPPEGGVALTNLIKHRSPASSVILLTDEEEEEELFQAIKGGAAAYVSRSLEPSELIEIIKRVAQGGCPVYENLFARPQVAFRVLKHFRELLRSGRDMEALRVPLSRREVEILTNITEGNVESDIASALKISVETLRAHLLSILLKLATNEDTLALLQALRGE